MKRIINLVREDKEIMEVLAFALFVIVNSIGVMFIKHDVFVSLILWLVSSVLMMETIAE